MAKKKQPLSTRIFSLVILGLFAGALLVGFFVPFLQRDEADKQQEELNKTIEELQKSEAEAEPAEVDENFKISGDITQMQIIDLVTGNGTEVKLGDKIRVRYKGALAADGTVFDKTEDGTPDPELPTFDLVEGALIQGWTEGIPGMKVGGKRRLVIPSEKGYGEQGTEGIPANADLVFEVELVAVNPPQ